MRLITDTARFSHAEFDSYTAAIQCAHAHAHDALEAVDSDCDFRGTRTYAEAHALATTGWPEGRAKLEKLAADIVTPSRVARPECVFDVTGEGGCDVGRAMSGHPECVFDWRDSDQTVESQNGPIVRIAFNTAVRADVKTAAIQYRGAAVLALIDALEAAGRRVELVIEKVNSVYRDDPRVFRISIPLKSTDFQAQPDQIAFALVHPSMNRRMMLSLTRRCGAMGRLSAAHAYGGTTKYRPEGYDIWIPRLEPDDVTDVVPHFGSQADAQQWVFARLAESGVTVNQGGN